MEQQKQAVVLVPETSLSTTMKKMLSAGTAASIAEIFTIPIDTTKVRLQLQGENVVTKGTGQALKYRGMIHALATITREEGVQSLFKGLNAGVQRQICFCGIRIGLYDSVRKMYGDSGEGKPKVIVKILASVTTASTAVLLFQPTEVVKIRFQAGGSKGRYSGTGAAYATIFRTEGMKGLWRGTSTNLFRLSVVNCTEIVVYDIIKSYVLYKQLMADDVPLHLSSAVGAGFVTCMITSPIDVVKTRFMNSSAGSYKTPIHCAIALLKQNGVTGFYKGFVPSFVRFGSWAIAFFVSYEQIKRLSGSNV